MPTCDEPVVIVGGPGQPRDERGGLDTASVIVCPLAPTHVLAMFRADVAARMDLDGWRDRRLYIDELDHAEDAEICREVVANTNRWTFELPTKRRASRMELPPKPTPWRMEDVGAVEQDGQEGRLMRFSTPNRWRSAKVVPRWPVRRWYE